MSALPRGTPENSLSFIIALTQEETLMYGLLGLFTPSFSTKMSECPAFKTVKSKVVGDKTKTWPVWDTCEFIKEDPQCN